jgi:hypothetical protein
MAFKDNIWWTRKARIQAERRLLSNAFQSQLLMLWYSFWGVAVSIYYLKIDNSNTHNNLPGISWVVYSVLTLCMSGFITGLSFKERAGLIKECYEALNTFYQKATEDGDIGALSKEYEQILGLCENHTDYDYYLALCIEYVTCTALINLETKLKEGLDRRPSWYHWFSLTYWTLRRYLLLALLYFLPIMLFFSLESLV